MYMLTQFTYHKCVICLLQGANIMHIIRVSKQVSYMYQKCVIRVLYEYQMVYHTSVIWEWYMCYRIQVLYTYHTAYTQKYVKKYVSGTVMQLG